MERESHGGRLIAKITVPARDEVLSAILVFVRDAASRQGFSGEDLERLEVLVEEACRNVIVHAFEPGEEGTFDVVLTRAPNQLVISIRDKGLPFDMQAVGEGRQAGLGLRLMRAFADKVRFSNLGQEGKQVDLVKFVPSKHVTDYLSEEEKIRREPRRPSEEPIELRFMRPDECVGLSQCVYRTYGYSYLSDFIYYPDRVREHLESGLMVSCVAVTPEGGIEGHLAMTLKRPGDRVAEVGQAVVAPEYRGRGLFTKMKAFLAEDARRRGLLGFYSEAATAHPFSQKGNLELGAHETGVLLAYAPATLEFKKITEDAQEDRPSAMLFYLRLNEGGERTVFPPLHHRSMLSRIYERSGLNRTLEERGARGDGLPQRSQIELLVLKDWGQGFIRIVEFGEDLHERVRFVLREMCRHGTACAFVDLPLANPASAPACAGLEALGFFFGGIVPEQDAGDILRLQYLNNVTVDPAKVCTASDFGRELLDYVVGAMGT
jgi:anti-sigma regulatory factor (Ser/Thr protein kinase)/GNAT superfamily N-acetyltransferase